jgi:hypothetical protein
VFVIGWIEQMIGSIKERDDKGKENEIILSMQVNVMNSKEGRRNNSQAEKR